MRRWRAVAAVAVAMLGGCRESDEQAEERMGRESDAFENVISILLVKYEQFEAAGLADSVASLYTDNAHVAFAGRSPLYGRMAVRDHLAAFYAAGRSSLNLRSEDAVASGPLGVEHGTYVREFAPGPDAPAELVVLFPDSGSYLAQWRRVDGQWQIAELVVSSASASARPAPR
jgi:ketosteroid isomerase-like protein